TLVTVTELTHSRADDDRRWQDKYSPRVHMWARQQTDILASEGPAALARYVRSIQSDPGVLNYLFDEGGLGGLGRGASPVLLHAANSMASQPPGSVLVDAHERFIAEKTADMDGRTYVVMVDYPSPSILNRSVVEFLSADLYTGGLKSAAIGRGLAVLLVAGV